MVSVPTTVYRQVSKEQVRPTIPFEHLISRTPDLLMILFSEDAPFQRSRSVAWDGSFNMRVPTRVMRRHRAEKRYAKEYLR